MRKQIKKPRVLRGKRAEFYVDKAVCVIIAVTIGALLLGGMYTLFNGTVLPGLAERIGDMFS